MLPWYKCGSIWFYLGLIKNFFYFFSILDRILFFFYFINLASPKIKLPEKVILRVPKDPFDVFLLDWCDISYNTHKNVNTANTNHRRSSKKKTTFSGIFILMVRFLCTCWINQTLKRRHIPSSICIPTLNRALPNTTQIPKYSHHSLIRLVKP